MSETVIHHALRPVHPCAHTYVHEEAHARTIDDDGDDDGDDDDGGDGDRSSFSPTPLGRWTKSAAEAIIYYTYPSRAILMTRQFTVPSRILPDGAYFQMG